MFGKKSTISFKRSVPIQTALPVNPTSASHNTCSASLRPGSRRALLKSPAGAGWSDAVLRLSLAQPRVCAAKGNFSLTQFRGKTTCAKVIADAHSRQLHAGFPIEKNQN